METALQSWLTDIAWPLLVNFGCKSGSTPATCSKKNNMGWRYLYIIVGGTCFDMAFVQALVIRSRESLRWLVASGRIQEAVDVLNNISTTNGSEYTVSVDQFANAAPEHVHDKSVNENLRRAGALFSGPKQVRQMICLSLMWAFIGVALATTASYTTYLVRLIY